MTVLEEIAARLRSEIPSRTVYEGAVPDGALPSRYLVVFTSEGNEDASTLSDVTDLREAFASVSSISSHGDPSIAQREAAWGAGKTRDAFRDWQPDLGRMSFKVRPSASQAAARDDSLPDSTFRAVEQFTVPYQA